MTPALPGVGSTPPVPPSPRLAVPRGWGPVPVPGPSCPPRWSQARPPAPAHTETTWRGCNRHGSGETRDTGVWVAGLAARQMGGWDTTAAPHGCRDGERGQWAPLGEAGETDVTERWRGLPQVRSPGQIGSGLPGALGSEADWLTNDMTQLQDGAWRHGMGGRPTQRHTGKEETQ